MASESCGKQPELEYNHSQPGTRMNDSILNWINAISYNRTHCLSHLQDMVKAHGQVTVELSALRPIAHASNKEGQSSPIKLNAIKLVGDAISGLPISTVQGEPQSKASRTLKYLVLQSSRDTAQQPSIGCTLKSAHIEHSGICKTQRVTALDPTSVREMMLRSNIHLYDAGSTKDDPYYNAQANVVPGTTIDESNEFPKIIRVCIAASSHFNTKLMTNVLLKVIILLHNLLFHKVK